MDINRGYRGKIGDFADAGRVLTIRMTTLGNAVYDTCCFGVDAADKIADERYTVFYNQPSSPAQEITYRVQGNSADYNLMLTSLPADIAKLVFTVSIDGNGTMGEIQSHTIEVIQDGNVAAKLSLSGRDFKNEKAVIALEVYIKSEWRISAVARGFDGGLDAILKSYGGEIADSSPAPVQPVVPEPVPVAVPEPIAPQISLSKEEQVAGKIMSKISLSKDKVNLEKHVISLSKCVVDLSKKSGIDLGNTRARVAVVMDYSGSMSRLYSNGTVQRTLNRLVPLGLTFDDNGSVDLYLFQSDFRKFPDLDLSNYENYVNGVIKQSGYDMGGTRYAPVLQAIIEGYTFRSGGIFRGHSERVEPIVNNYCPTFVLFITDGENNDKAESDSIIRRASAMNLFIQFIGIGNERFNYLMKLDDLSGRTRDNTGFSKMADLDSASDDVLYTNILEQFSKWLMGIQ